MTVAARVTALREFLGFTQAQLSRRSGLTRAEINALEHARNQGTSERVHRGLAEAAGVSSNRLEDYLVGRLPLEKLIPHQTALERILELEPERWNSSVLAVAKELEASGTDLSPAGWVYQLDTLQAAIVPVLPKQHS